MSITVADANMQGIILQAIMEDPNRVEETFAIQVTNGEISRKPQANFSLSEM
ncbi:hypothetical protein GCM10011413_37410 [Pedobacter psychrotolerans]|uniref:Uncharacterized protein n=1 Tax=Pedobacter psychrotolerans TaxID=1843235 RepID=A0ABQ1SXR7_9SPHI|nr:hypothetical protein GCM10011413_37410 [Pedobacter psychrotolerans]